MTDANEFVENFLKHAYDPVKAHEYYLRIRQLKGKAAADAQYEKMNVKDAQKTLNADLKKAGPVKMNPKRRIGDAEQKLIRAKSLAERIQDPKVKARMLKRLSDVEAKLRHLKRKHGVTSKTTGHHHPKNSLRSRTKSHSTSSGKPLDARKNTPQGAGYRGPA